MSDKKIYLARPLVGKEELEKIKEVLDSKYMTEGPITRGFESKFAEYVGTKHAIAVTSCTTGLELCLRILGIGPGDEIIVPDFTHPATGDVAFLVGAKPVLVDVDIESRNITADFIRESVTEKTKCIMPVSWGGNPLDPEIYELGGELGIPIIEDAACSVGAEIDGKRVGSLAEMSVFSFHPRKTISTGEGGMITTSDDEFAEKLMLFKNFGMKSGKFIQIGTNYKLCNILGAIGLEQLKKIETILEDRIKKAKLYNELLKDVENVRVPVVRPNVRHTFQSYTIYIEKDGIRDKLRENLLKQNIEVQIGTYALHLEPAFADARKVGKLENSKKLFENLLTLPLHHELNDEDQRMVCEKISEFLKNR